jgi:hypothetical protein
MLLGTYFLIYVPAVSFVADAWDPLWPIALFTALPGILLADAAASFIPYYHSWGVGSAGIFGRNPTTSGYFMGTAMILISQLLLSRVGSALMMRLRSTKSAAKRAGLAPFRRTPELSRCAAIPVAVLVVDGAHHVDG